MKKYTRWILIILIAVAVFVWSEVVRSPEDNSAHVYFLNVGQGDAELIQKGDYQILIDGGPDDSVLSELGKAMPLSDRKIETVILTHPHADHLTGLNQVIDRYTIGKIYFSGATYTTNGYLEFLSKVKDKNISIEVPSVGELIAPFADGKLTFLWPGDKYKEQTPKNLNDVSEVAKFCYFDQCALLTGDIETDEQKAMFDSCNIAAFDSTTPNPSSERRGGTCDFSAQILKISHHGSINGTDIAILDKVKPQYAVIEVGADNKFGHPHAQILDLLNSQNISISRTDRDGTVEFFLTQTGIVKK